MSSLSRAISEHEAIYHLRELYPELHDLGWLLWNVTSFPFWDGEDPLLHWIAQMEEWLAEFGEEEGGTKGRGRG